MLTDCSGAFQAKNQRGFFSQGTAFLLGGPGGLSSPGSAANSPELVETLRMLAADGPLLRLVIGVSRVSGPEIPQKCLKKSLSGGLQKTSRKHPKNTQNWFSGGHLFSLSGAFGNFLQSSKRTLTLFEKILGDFGPGGPGDSCRWSLGSQVHWAKVKEMSSRQDIALLLKCRNRVLGLKGGLVLGTRGWLLSKPDSNGKPAATEKKVDAKGAQLLLLLSTTPRCASGPKHR